MLQTTSFLSSHIYHSDSHVVRVFQLMHSSHQYHAVMEKQKLTCVLLSILQRQAKICSIHTKLTEVNLYQQQQQGTASSHVLCWSESLAGIASGVWGSSHVVCSTVSLISVTPTKPYHLPLPQIFSPLQATTVC